MVDYRFTLTYQSTDYVLAANEQPKDFRDIQSSIKRDFKTHGTFYAFSDGTLKLGFVGTGYDVLESAWINDGIDAIVTLKVERRPDEFTAYSNIYEGRANFKSYEQTRKYFNIEFEEVNLQTKIRARKNAEYNVTKTQNLDGGVIVPDLTQMQFESVVIRYVSNYGMDVFDFTTDTGVSISSGTTTSTSSGNLVDNTANFINDGVRPGDFVENTTTPAETFVVEVTDEGLLSLNTNIFTSGEDYIIYSQRGVNIFNGQDLFIDGKNELSFIDGENALINNTVSQDSFVQFAKNRERMITVETGGQVYNFLPMGNGFFLRKQIGIDSYDVDFDVSCRFNSVSGARLALIAFDLDEDDNISTATDINLAADNAGTNRYDENWTVTIGDQNKKVLFGFVTEGTGSITITTSALGSPAVDLDTDKTVTCFVQATWDSIYTDTQIQGQLVHEAIDKNLEYITGEQNLLYSNYFGRTDLGYDTDGCGSMFMESNGYNIRGDSRGAVSSLKDRLNNLNGIFGIGHGLQLKDYDKENYEYRVEPLEYFYQNSEMASFDNIKKDTYAETYFQDLDFNTIKTGYAKFADSEQNAAAQLDWHTEQQYLIPFAESAPQSDEEGNIRIYDITSDYIASPYLWEITRRQQFAVNPTSSWKYDEDVFIIQLQDDYPNFKKRSRLSTVAAVSSGTDLNEPLIHNTYFNYLISPRYNIFNHGALLNSVIQQKLDTFEYVNTQSKLLTDLSYRQQTLGGFCLGDTTGVTKAVNANIVKQDIFNGEGLFLPIAISFEASMTTAQEEQIRLGHRNGLNENNYGYITVTDPNGNQKSGWLLELSYNPVKEIGKFMLIKKNDYAPL